MTNALNPTQHCRPLLRRCRSDVRSSDAEAAAQAAGNVLFALPTKRERAGASSGERGGGAGCGGGCEFKLRKRQSTADGRTDKSRSNVEDIFRYNNTSVREKTETSSELK